MATKRTLTKSTSRTASKSSAKKTIAKKQTDKTGKTSLTKDTITMSSMEAESQSPMPSKNTKRFRVNGIIALVLLLVAAAIYFLKDQVVVAMVNGSPIMRWEIINALEEQSGKEALDSLVLKKLIEQEAQKNGVSATSEDMDAKIAEIEESVKSQGQELDSLLEMQGMTREDLRKQMKIQILIEKLVAASISVTDEDINKFMEEQKEFLKDDQDMDKVREDIRKHLTDQKISDAAIELTDKLKEQASIEYLRKY